MGRVMAVWCPDWPAMAAAADEDLPPAQPIAVLSANRVTATSATARAAGVRRGMRKRQAQAVCPEMRVFTADVDRDARFFEPVVAAVAEVVAVVEVLRPGLVVMPADGAARHHGGEESLAEQLVDQISVCGVESQVGVADELFTAVIAARRGHHVEPGASRAYLADLPVAELNVEQSLSVPERAELVDLLRRLGLVTIGDFAAMSARDVATRFSADAAVAHRLANALTDRRPSGSAVAPELVIEYVCEPPIDRIDAAAFAGRRLADMLHRRLADVPAACTKLKVEAVTERGQRHSRIWRCAQPLTPDATADRIRWQLEGWLTGAGRGRSRGDTRPDSPVAMLRLEPVETVDAGELRYALTGAGLPGESEVSERARRSLERVQGLLGGDAVQVPVRSGGRGPSEQITMIPLGDEKIPERDPQAPWPGRVPQPAPAVMSRAPVSLTDASGQPVTVTGRGAFSDEPAVVRMARPGRDAARDTWALSWWAGPWPAGMDDTGIVARAQVLLEDSRALLLYYRAGDWMVEGVYE
ncbi:DNA polymerase Y family protein [Gordonia jacobaea]|uniref:DNA polymerase Y family protein n=1 Tax=Gordonia jacobaea TaxID=122202 RepID=UPI003D759EE4